MDTESKNTPQKMQWMHPKILRNIYKILIKSSKFTGCMAVWGGGLVSGGGVQGFTGSKRCMPLLPRTSDFKDLQEQEPWVTS